MIIEQIYTDNAYRNFNYLIACPETGEALAVDPLEADMCARRANELGWKITQILNTHEHPDHIGGNDRMVELTGAKVIAHAGAKDKIPGMDTGLAAGDIVKIGKTVELEALDTPGHTMSHICLFAHVDQPALICGDTLFNAGAGNCKGGGHPDELYDTFANQLARLPDSTRIYPGHDYLANNLGFTLNREPDNARARAMIDNAEKQDPHNATITNLGLEKEINAFFRLTNPSLIATLRESCPDLSDQPTPREVFVKLRELRNHW